MSTQIVPSPNAPRSSDPRVTEMADMLARIERNYEREGSGPGTRFEGRLLEDVQAEAIIRNLEPLITAAERLRWRAILATHYLMGINCDHETRRDNPMCACSQVHLGWHPSVGAAVQAWIDHVADLIGETP